MPPDVIDRYVNVLKLNTMTDYPSAGLGSFFSAIYLTDLADFTKVNEVYGGYLGATPPARATVQVAGLPRGARVEIDAVAVVAPPG